MGRKDVQRPTRVTKPTTPAPTPPPTPPTPAPKPQKPQHSRTTQVQHQNKQQVHPIQKAVTQSPIPQAQAMTQSISPPPKEKSPYLQYHPSTPSGITQYGGANTQKIVHDPKPNPRGTQVIKTGQQYTATDKSFSLKEGEYGTLTPTGTVPIQQPPPAAMGSPTGYVPAKHIKNKKFTETRVNFPTSVANPDPKSRTYTEYNTTPSLKDTNSFKQSFEHPFGQPTGNEINPKQDKKVKGQYTDVQLGFFDPPEKDIVRGTSDGEEYAFYYTGQGDRDDWGYSEKKVEHKTWLGDPYTQTIETSPWQWYTGEEKVMGAEVVEKKHKSKTTTYTKIWERKGQPVVYEAGKTDGYNVFKQQNQLHKQNLKAHDKYVFDFFNTEKKQRRKDKFFSHYLND